MTLFDVTLPIYPGMPVYEGDPEVALERRLSMAQGAPADVSLLSLGTHTGTHVDAPAHFRLGAPGVDRLPLDILVGPARVYAVEGAGHIEADSLRGLDLQARTRLLFKTRNSATRQEGRFQRDYAALTGGAARLLVAAGVRLVGLDGPSADPSGSGDFPAHVTLLDAGVLVLEGLDLSEVPPGDYELFCLPLKIRDADGAPARVLLRQPEADPPPARPDAAGRRRRRR